MKVLKLPKHHTLVWGAGCWCSRFVHDAFATTIRAGEQMILAAETWYRTAQISVKGLDGWLSSIMTTWKLI